MDKDTIWRILMISFLIINTILFIPLGGILWDYYGPELETMMKVNNVTSCGNLTLKDTAYCLVEITKPIYKYNITDDDTQLTFEALKKGGGDCKDWTEYYLEIAKKLGFYTYAVRIDMNETNDHIFAVISNDEGYCTIDALNYNCVNYG